MSSLRPCRRVLLVSALALVAAGFAPVASFAEEAAPSDPAAESAAPPAGSADGEEMKGCVNSATGGCCTTCRENAAKAKATGEAPGDCPCKRAKQAARKKS
jgi:hypothetical protein